MRRQFTCRILVVTILLIISSMSSQAQDGYHSSYRDKIHSNAIIGDIGLGIYFGYPGVYMSGQYERIILYRRSDNFAYTFFRIGAGNVGSWGSSDGLILGQVGLLLWPNKHHMEVAGGLVLFNFESIFEEYGNSDILPNVTLGYRLQNPGKSFILRTGIGYPEVVYLGFGLSFL